MSALSRCTTSTTTPLLGGSASAAVERLVTLWRVALVCQQVGRWLHALLCTVTSCTNGADSAAQLVQALLCLPCDDVPVVSSVVDVAVVCIVADSKYAKWRDNACGDTTTFGLQPGLIGRLDWYIRLGLELPRFLYSR